MCGDFNAIVDQKMDTSISSLNRSHRDTLSNFLDSSSMFDVWRCQHATEKDFTFFSHAHKTYTRINLFLTDKFLLQNVYKSEIGNITWSDHTPVSITVGGGNLRTRANRWRNNALLMSCPEHRHQIQQALQEFFDLNAPSEVGSESHLPSLKLCKK